MNGQREVRETIVETAVGPVRALSADGTVLALGFEEGWKARVQRRLRGMPDAVRVPGADPEVEHALAAYVGGDLHAIDALAVAQSGTAFQQRVWDALRGIPAGRTESYGRLAARLGFPEGARAVGSAAARNAIALIVPCHRLVGARGELTGFAHGVERKRWLLEHEGAWVAQPRFAERAIA